MWWCRGTVKRRERDGIQGMTETESIDAQSRSDSRAVAETDARRHGDCPGTRGGAREPPKTPFK